MSDRPAKAQKVAQLVLEENEDAVRGGSSGQVDLDPANIPVACLARSKLLQELSDICGKATIPITPKAYDAWMQYVLADISRSNSPQPPESGSTHNGSDASNSDDDPAVVDSHQIPTADDHFQLIQAADVLIDERTKAQMAGHIGCLLGGYKDRDVLEKAVQDRVLSLPEHLLLAILSTVLLPNCLLHLPTAFHLSALRAHHPSIDTSHSLHLFHIPPEAMHAAIHSIAHLTALSTLSFSTATFPHSRPLPFEALQPLQRLTYLNLSDLGTALGATGVSIAQLLPKLPALQHLDMSNNAFSEQASKALKQAISSCTALKRLVLNRMDPGYEFEAGEAALRLLPHDAPQLSALSIGIREYPDERPCNCSILNNALYGAEVFPELRELTLGLPCCAKMHPMDVAGACMTLADLTYLTHLCISIPVINKNVVEEAEDLEDPEWQEVQVQESGQEGDMFGHALGKLTGLLSLDLTFATQALSFGDPADEEAAPWTGGVLAHLSRLTALTRLSLTVGDARAPMMHEVGAADAQCVWKLLHEALGHLAHLQVLHTDIDFDTVCPPAAAEMVSKAGVHPAIRQLSLVVRVRHDVARVLLPALLPVAAKKFPVLELTVHADIVNSSASLAPFLPLLPSVKSITIGVHARQRVLKTKLTPLLQAVPELVAVMHVKVSVDRVPKGGCAQQLMDAVATLATLQSLEYSYHLNPERQEMDDGDSGEDSDLEDWQLEREGGMPVSVVAMQSIRGLTALTSLDFVITPWFTHICQLADACGGLAALRKLSIRVSVWDEEEEVIEALSRLHLLTLVVHADRDSKDLVRGLIPRLSHLRTVNFLKVDFEDGKWQRELNNLISPLLACRHSYKVMT